MNEELKVRSFRLSEEVFEKIKHLSEDFDNQNAALERLMKCSRQKLFSPIGRQI